MQSNTLWRGVFVLALCGASLWGQTVSSSMVGTVVDATNAVVGSAHVTLNDPATGSVRNTTTDVSGIFRFIDLAPGTFRPSAVRPASEHCRIRIAF